MILKSKPNFPELKTPPEEISSLYPDLTPNEQAAANHTLKRYVALVWRIYQRIRREKKRKI